MEIPRQVIQRLYQYLETGCTLKVVTEDFDGEQIQRWIANDNYVLWSAPVQNAPKKGGTL